MLILYIDTSRRTKNMQTKSLVCSCLKPILIMTKHNKGFCSGKCYEQPFSGHIHMPTIPISAIVLFTHQSSGELGLFNAKIRNENRLYINRLIYQLNKQDLLCHSVQNVSLILVTSLLDEGLK